MGDWQEAGWSGCWGGLVGVGVVGVRGVEWVVGVVGVGQGDLDVL